MDYHRLREIEREELESSALAKVEPHFYEHAKALISELEQKAKENPTEYFRELEGARRSFNKIVAKRIEKIVLTTARGHAPQNLVGPETSLQQNISLAMMGFREEIEGIEPHKNDRKKEFLPEGKKKVRLKKYVDAYIGVNGKTYGPFKEGDEVIIEAEEAEWLEKEGYGEILA